MVSFAEVQVMFKFEQANTCSCHAFVNAMLPNHNMNRYSNDRCDQPILDTSDMLCGCRLKRALNEPKCDWPPPSPPTPPTPPTSECCRRDRQKHRRALFGAYIGVILRRLSRGILFRPVVHVPKKKSSLSR